MGFLIGEGRVGRLIHFGIEMALVLVVAASFLVGTSTDEITGEVSAHPIAGLIVVLAIWFSWTNKIRRLHDLGRNGWMSLFMLVPIVSLVLSLYLYFAPGDDVPNKYGPPPGSAPLTINDHREQMREITMAHSGGEPVDPNVAYTNPDGSFDMEGLVVPGLSLGDQPPAGDVLQASAPSGSPEGFDPHTF